MPAFHQRAPLGRQSHASLVGSATCLLVMEAVTLGHLELSGHRASEDSAVQARGDEGRAGVYKLQEIITGPDAEKGFAKKILFMEYFLLIAAKSQPKRPCSVLKPCCPFRGTLRHPTSCLPLDIGGGGKMGVTHHIHKQGLSHLRAHTPVMGEPRTCDSG